MGGIGIVGGLGIAELALQPAQLVAFGLDFLQR